MIRRATRRLLGLVAAAGGLFIAGSWMASRRLAGRLVSGTGLGPTPDRGRELAAALAGAGATVHELRHAGAALDPVELAATFATPGDPRGRPTLVFLHGKGGHSSEWEPDALRAISLGYNVLLPDLRAHGASGGRYMTFGFLEKDDLARCLEAARDRWGIDVGRIGLQSCSAGSAIALELAASHPGVRALWLESPFADPREMARHYLSIATGVPAVLLSLATRWAVARSLARLRRDLSLDPRAGGLERADPVAALERIRCPVFLVYGERDRLIPPAFVARLEDSLPAGSSVWRASGAGHCHHPDEAAKVSPDGYARRWSEFFTRHLPAAPAAFADRPSSP